ncbi:MAG: hypothetical protein IJ019_01295 [Alphaproteobacteria bacterium]|nr:hypothetical protein [Alphaproteobacteria bacterium]
MGIIGYLRNARRNRKKEVLKKALKNAKNKEEKLSLLRKHLKGNWFADSVISTVIDIMKQVDNGDLSAESYEILKMTHKSFSQECLRRLGVNVGKIYKEASDENITSMISSGEIDYRDMKDIPEKHLGLLISNIINGDKTSYWLKKYGLSSVLSDKQYTEIALSEGLLNPDGVYEYDVYEYTDGGIQYKGSEPYLYMASYESVEVLLQHGADPNKNYMISEEYDHGYSFYHRETPVINVVSSEKVSLFLKYGANPFNIDDSRFSKNNPIHQEISEARAKGEQYYLSGHARIDALKKYAVLPKEELQKIISQIEKEASSKMKEDPLKLRMDKLKEKLGNNVGKTADPKTNNIRVEDIRKADETVKIIKPMIKDKYRE